MTRSQNEDALPNSWQCVFSTVKGHEVFFRVELEANAGADFDLPVASWFFLRRTAGQGSETAWP